MEAVAARLAAGRGDCFPTHLATDFGRGPEAVADGLAAGRGFFFPTPLATDFGGTGESRAMAGLLDGEYHLLDGEFASLRLSPLTSGLAGSLTLAEAPSSVAGFMFSSIRRYLP